MGSLFNFCCCCCCRGCCCCCCCCFFIPSFTEFFLTTTSCNGDDQPNGSVLESFDRFSFFFFVLFCPQVSEAGAQKWPRKKPKKKRKKEKKNPGEFMNSPAALIPLL